MFLLGRYVVSIEELVSQDFEIDAPSVEEAKRIAKEKYNNCEIVLEPGELQTKRLSVINENGVSGDWEEF